MAAVAEALHSEVECDSNHQEISQAVFCVTGPMQQDQLPEDAKVRVVNISGCDKERQDQLVSVFLSEACGVPVHLESNEDDMDDMDDNGSARTVVLKGQDGDHLVLLLSSEMCEIQLAPGILAHMVHILGDPEDANLDALFCAMPERTDDISLSLLFPEDLPESIWSGLAATSKSAGFRSVSAVPLCHASSLSHELAQHIMSAPAIPFQKLVESYNNALQSETRDGIQKRMVANKQAVEGVAESAELYAQRLESYTDHLPLPKDKLVEVSNDAVRECWDKLNARLEYLDLTSDESAAHKAECMRRISRDQTNLCKMNMLKSVSQCWQVARERWSSVMDSLPPEHMASHLETERRSLPVIVDLITHFTKVYESDPRAVGPAKLLVLDGFMREKAAVVEHLVHLSEQEDVAQKEELRFALDLAEAVRQQDVAEMLSSMRFMEEVQAEEKMYVQALEASYERRAAEVFEETLAATDRAAQDAADQQQAAAQQAAQRAVDVTNQAFDNLRNVSERLGNELSDEADKLNSASENLTKLEQDIKELNKPKWYETLGQWLLVGASAIAGVALCVVGGPVGALVGGMLLSAGLSTGMKMAFNGGTLDWKEFGVSVGVGAATGLVSGGIGLGVGAALSGVTGAIGVASCGTKLLVGGIHAAAQAAGGAVSSMAGTVIDNLAHQRTWHEGLGQAATAGAVTGFVSGSIAGFSACREAASKAAEASKAAKTSVEQIGSRAAEVAPTKALCKAGAAFLESASTGTVDGLLTAAFDSNINLGDAALMGFVGGCVAGAAGAAIAGGRAKWEARRQKKVIEQMKKDGFLDANGVPTDKHEHSYLHHSATITEAEQITRITTGIDGTEPTPVSGAFHDGDSLKKVSVQADAKMTAAGQKIAADMNTNPDSVKKLTKLQSREVRLEKLQERNDYILSKMKSSTSKADRKALGKQLGSLKQKRSTLHRHIKGANDEKFAARTIEIGEPQAGGSWGSSLKKEDGVIKQLKDCKAAAVNVKYTFGVDHGQVIVTKTSIVSAYPMAADGQKYIKPKMLKLDPLNAVKHQVAVQQAARNMAKATNPENLPDGWATAVTHEGQRYFFNKELGRVQWEHPYL